MSSTILPLKFAAAVKFTPKRPITHAVATSTTTPKCHNVVTTTLSSQARAHVLATKFKPSAGLKHCRTIEMHV